MRPEGLTLAKQVAVATGLVVMAIGDSIQALRERLTRLIDETVSKATDSTGEYLENAVTRAVNDQLDDWYGTGAITKDQRDALADDVKAGTDGLYTGRSWTDMFKDNATTWVIVGVAVVAAYFLFFKKDGGRNYGS